MFRKDIEEKATQILKDHGMLQIPVDPLQLAHQFDIKVMNAVFSDKNISGAIARRNNISTIYVNNIDSPSRKRFTIAHELGHYLLHLSDKKDIEILDGVDNFREISSECPTAWNNAKQMEWEANAFAAALLMNKDSVTKAWNEHKNVDYLAWLFQVSISAMTIRLASLKLIELEE